MNFEICKKKIRKKKYSFFPSRDSAPYGHTTALRAHGATLAQSSRRPALLPLLGRDSVPNCFSQVLLFLVLLLAFASRSLFVLCCSFLL